MCCEPGRLAVRKSKNTRLMPGVCEKGEFYCLMMAAAVPAAAATAVEAAAVMESTTKTAAMESTAKIKPE